MSYCLLHDKRINCPMCEPDLIPPKFRTMPTQPQAVTERYVSNLIHNGRNKEFDIIAIERCFSKSADNEVVGVYFVCVVELANDPTTFKSAPGASIAQAVRRALEKHGVTFR